MFEPKKMKHRKWHKGRSRGIERRGTELSFGSFGLKALSAKWVTSAQLEAARRAIIRYLKKKGKLWIRIFPSKPVTSKGAEVVEEKLAKEIFRKASDKLSVKTKFVKK